jgi:ankyrin repeat protein
MLLQANVDVNARKSDGWTAVMLAVSWSEEDCVKVLLEHQANLHCTAESNSLLSIAVQKDNPKLAFMLLDAGMDPCHEAVMEINKLQLHVCVESNRVELLQRLLLYNFLIDQKDKHGRTSLNCIGPESDIAILRLLVHRGATVNTADNEEETPLSKMVRSNDVQKAEFLISKGANPHARIGWFGTPLHLACRLSSLEMIRMLIDRGADTDNVHEGDMGTIFQAACQRDNGTNDENLAVLAYLLNTGKVDKKQSSRRWGNNLNTACLVADMKIMKLLINSGVDVNGEDRLGRRPIHFALYRTLEQVEYLRGRGADLFAKDVMQRNALHFAVASGRLDIVKYVLNEKPELVNEGDCDEWTPLFWAVREHLYWGTETAERHAIIKELKAHKAKIMIQGEGVDKRWTPYELARYYNLNDEIVKELTPNQKKVEKSNNVALWQRILDTPTQKATPDRAGFCDVCLMVSKVCCVVIVHPLAKLGIGTNNRRILCLHGMQGLFIVFQVLSIQKHNPSRTRLFNIWRCGR